MRALLGLCLVSSLLAGEPQLPGRSTAFLGKVLADSQGGTQPWKTFRVPEDAGSAVVEVVGEYNSEELRQVAFQEFLVWFREDLKRFWRNQGYLEAGTDEAWSAMPVLRYGGNPVPRNVPLGRIGF